MKSVGHSEALLSILNAPIPDSPVTVAVLDDDSSVLKAVARLLRSASLKVAAFQDPAEFLQHASSHQLTVALLDMRMPIMNGLEVQTRLQQFSPCTEVVFLTSHDDPSARQKALTAGAFAFLLKPADDDELVSVIQSAARRTR